jgi:nucleotide-binding universal stress UspA family protein
MNLQEASGVQTENRRDQPLPEYRRILPGAKFVLQCCCRLYLERVNAGSSILVPVDFSDVTPKVIRHAVRLAEAFKSRIILLHVAEPEPEFIGFEPGPPSVRVSMAVDFHAEHRKLEEIKEELTASGLQVQAFQIQGPTAEKILSEAEQHQSEMIVIGSHGHGALYNLLTGSVAAGVLKSARCPVLVVPAAEK